MTRTLALCVALVAVAGCERDNPNFTVTSYCDDSGCFTCRDREHTMCWPTPHDACNGANDCQQGQVCTNLGCLSSCHGTSDCKPGEICTGDAVCAPSETTPVVVSLPRPVDPQCTNDAACGAGKLCTAGACVAICSGNTQCASGFACMNGKCYPATAPACGLPASLCTANADCGAGRACAGGTCHVNCSAGAACPGGQACSAGVCLDATPSKAQCLWDKDCGPASRCINATCHALCGSQTQCMSGEFCDSGVCRADYRPAR